MAGNGTAFNGNYSFEGEIDRRFNDMSVRLSEMATRLETQYVRVDVFEATKRLTDSEMSQISIRVGKLESRNEWLIRIIGGGVVTAILSGLFFYGKVKNGA